MPLSGSGTVRVPIGTEWYDLKTEIGWYEQQRIRDARIRAGLPLEAPLLMPEIDLRISKAEEDLARLRARIIAWSHADPVSEETIKRIPTGHAELLLDKIALLERDEVRLGLPTEGKG